VPTPTFFDDPQLLAPRQVVQLPHASGGFVLRSPVPLQPYARCVGEWLEHWGQATPDAVAFAESSGQTDGSWATLTWRRLRQQVGAVAQSLLNLELPTDQPIVVLSDNSLHHLVLLLAGMHVGRAVCTVSSGYCRLAGGDFSRIHGILHTLQPALVYAHDAATYAPALADAKLTAHVVYSQGADGVAGALPFSHLLAALETPAVMQAFAQITPDTHAKYLLTSGSTGTPKVVVNTHRMLCANQQMLAQTLPFLTREKPVLLDWLPWSHTFGGNHNVNMVLMHGGSLYIDDGRPVPGAINKTLAHLASGPHGVQPTVYFNVPKGYEMMLPALEANDGLARHFFERLRMVFYAGAGMPLSTWQRLEAVAARVRDEPVWFTTSWGSTETAPAVTFAHWRIDRPGVIGLPMPGAEVKFVPAGSAGASGGAKLEMRVRGPNVFTAYRNNPAATAAAFDDEGYYCIGDAGYLAAPGDINQGVVFDGRVAEDFKLTSGTWVSAGALRLRVVSALAPWVQDVVVTGHDRNEVGVLVFVSEAGRAQTAEVLAQHVRAGLQSLRAEGAGSSQTPTCALLLSDAPSMAAGEITDKGYINQRLTLQRRAADVELLHSGVAHATVVTV
jgi:feruloyl-CoA synthase